MVEGVGRGGSDFRLQLIGREPEAGVKQLFELMPAGHLCERDLDSLRLGFGTGDLHDPVQNVLVDMHGHFHNEAYGMAVLPYCKKRVWLYSHTLFGSMR